MRDEQRAEFRRKLLFQIRKLYSTLNIYIHAAPHIYRIYSIPNMLSKADKTGNDHPNVWSDSAFYSQWSPSYFK